MTDDIELIFVKHDTPYWERNISFKTIIWPRDTNSNTTMEVTRAVTRFLAEIDVTI